MSASVPWSVNAVEPETWAAARDAARRSGLSVGEWLDTAIRECAVSSERPRRSLRGADPLEQRLEDIAERLEQFSRKNTDFSDSRGRPDGALYSSIETLNERIDAMMRDRSHDRNAPSEVRSAIQRLDDRIEDMISRNRLSNAAASPDLERKLESISRTIETMSRKLEHENVRIADYSIPPSVAELDSAVAEIMMRQSALDGTPMPSQFQQRQAQMPVMPAPDFSGIESQLKNLTEEMHAIRRSGMQAEGIDGLRREITELADKLIELAPRRSLEALERAVETLVNRIDRGSLGANTSNSGEIAQTLEEIRAAIASVRPAESFASVERELTELSGKLDTMNARGVDGSTVVRLQEQTAEIREMLTDALPTDMLKGLCVQIETLVHKFEGTPQGPDNNAVVDIMAAFDRRIETLSERIDHAAKQTPATPDLGEIRSRLDDMMHSIGKSGQAASTNMESGLRALSDKLDAAESRLSVLGVIEKNVKDLFAQMQEVRITAVPVPESGDYADRPAKPAGREMISTEPAPAHEPKRPMLVEEPGLKAPQLRPEPRLNTALPRNDRIIDLPDDIAPDFPLEPGSGAPRHRASQTAAQRVAQSEAALGGISQMDQSTRATDYIAAARRAAQSAAAEPVNDDRKKFAIGEEPQKKASGLLVTRGRQAFLIALTAFLLIFTAMRYFDGMFPSLPFNNTPAPKPADQSVPVEPASAPQKNSALPEQPLASFLTTSPAGIIGPHQNVPILGEAKGEAEPETTGSVKSAKPTASPVQTASVPTGKETVAAKGDELPVTIGSQGLRAAAVSGDAIASYEIGARYLEGRGVPVNASQAMNWFERALKKGSAPAAYRIGGIHEKGHGVAKSPQEAKRYYLIAAEAGHIKAMHNLAVLYSEGVDGSPDYKSATRWFRMAAERGVADSQYNLGILYARGLGVDQNLTESYRWFALASGQGDQDAGKKRDDVAKRLDNQTLVAAKLAVQTWAPAHVNAAANSTQLNPEWEKGEGPARRRSVKK